MKKHRHALLLLPLLVAAAAPAAASEQLTQKYACVGCHQAQAKGVGPSWQAIRDKYKDGSVPAEQLAKNIKAGSTGKWGAIPMPPQAAVPDADAQAIAKWVLGS